MTAILITPPLGLVLVYHVTWLVNSATHCWGWHNNHHAYPSSARMGFRWWELDLTWQHIRLLHRFGLARRIRLAPLLLKTNASI